MARRNGKPCNGRVEVDAYVRKDGVEVEAYVRSCGYDHTKLTEEDLRELMKGKAYRDEHDPEHEKIAEVVEKGFERLYPKETEEKWPEVPVPPPWKNAQNLLAEKVEPTQEAVAETPTQKVEEIPLIEARYLTPEKLDEMLLAPPLTDEQLMEKQLPAIKKEENFIEHLYNDIFGKTTVGPGFHVEEEKDMDKYNMTVPATGALAPKAQARAEWRNVHALPGSENFKSQGTNKRGTEKIYNYLASAYKPYTTLTISEREGDRLMRVKYKEKVAMTRRVMNKKGIDYDSLPNGAKWVLLDMMYQGNFGPNSDWTRFYDALRARDWAKAAEHCVGEDISPSRNERRQKIFLRMVELGIK